MRLTERTIKCIRPPETGYSIIWDENLPGLGVRTTASGVQSFIFNYRNAEGVQRRTTLGRFPSLSATAARLKARELKARNDLGTDPLQAKQDRRNGLNLTELVDLYSARWLRNLRAGDQTERYLRAEALPWFGRNPKVATIKRRDIIRMCEEKAMRAPVSANRLLAAMKSLCTWAVERDFLDANPAAGIRRPSPEKSRDRVLSEDEIRALWEALPGARHMTENTRTALKLILLLAQRPGEVCGLEWSELDLARGWWELSREKTKSDRTHRVPLSPMVLKLIDAQPKADRWVFPSVNDQPLKRLALSHAVRRNNFMQLERWTPHDLRRTAASHMAAAGVQRFTIERVLNHADRSMGGVYDRYSYDKEKRRALERWARKLRSIIGEPTGATVVSIG